VTNDCGLHERDAGERGFRLIGYDRPGHGESSPPPARTVADTAADVRAICAELGIERRVTWGHSGGVTPRWWTTCPCHSWLSEHR
jgi:pimeloyl-ACP methyl ester carboxylesterase